MLQGIVHKPFPVAQELQPFRNGHGNKPAAGKTDGKDILPWAVSLQKFLWRAVNVPLLDEAGDFCLVELLLGGALLFWSLLKP